MGKEMQRHLHEAITCHQGTMGPSRVDDVSLETVGVKSTSSLSPTLDINLSEDENIRITLHAVTGCVELVVAQDDPVLDVVEATVGTGHADLKIELGGTDVSGGTFKDSCIESGANITVTWRELQRGAEYDWLPMGKYMHQDREVVRIITGQIKSKHRVFYADGTHADVDESCALALIAEFHFNVYTITNTGYDVIFSSFEAYPREDPTEAEWERFDNIHCFGSRRKHSSSMSHGYV